MDSGWSRATSETDPAALRERVARSVRELRAASGRSLADVALAAGIGKSTLHAIEAGSANPGIETLWALARALEVPFGALLEPPTATVRVVRAGEGPRVDTEDASMQAHLLATSAHGARVELYTLHVEPTHARVAEPHGQGTIEHVLVIAGRLAVGPDDDLVELAPGDFASFSGNVPHRFDAIDGSVEAILLIEYR